MTLPTPREAAEALHPQLFGKNAWAGRNALLDIIEAAFAARDRALLAEDEAAIEAMAKAIAKAERNQDNGWTEKVWRSWIVPARAVLAALRQLRGVEP